MPVKMNRLRLPSDAVSNNRRISWFFLSEISRLFSPLKRSVVINSVK